MLLLDVTQMERFCLAANARAAWAGLAPEHEAYQLLEQLVDVIQGYALELQQFIDEQQAMAELAALPRGAKQ